MSWHFGPFLAVVAISTGAGRVSPAGADGWHWLLVSQCDYAISRRHVDLSPQVYDAKMQQAGTGPEEGGKQPGRKFRFIPPGRKILPASKRFAESGGGNRGGRKEKYDVWHA
ncbi:MAG: hypothetical protein JXM70_23920 [Pirellulales bacterium]|nr:hypothetical protein [Pirellulales bacterium]